MAAAVLRRWCVTAHRSCRPDALQVLRRPAFHGGRRLRPSSHRRHVARGHDRRGLCDLRTCLAGAVADGWERRPSNTDFPTRRLPCGEMPITRSRCCASLTRSLSGWWSRSTRLENLARTASAAAVRLDKDEAPQREIDRQKNEASDLAAAQEKAKTENKAQFKP